MPICEAPPETSLSPRPPDPDTWTDWAGSIVIGTLSGAGILQSPQAVASLWAQTREDGFEEIHPTALAVTGQHELQLEFKLTGTEELVRYLIAGFALQTARKAGLQPQDTVLKHGKLVTHEQLAEDVQHGRVRQLNDYPLHGLLYATCAELTDWARGLQAKDHGVQPVRDRQALPVTVT